MLIHLAAVFPYYCRQPYLRNSLKTITGFQFRCLYISPLDSFIILDASPKWGNKLWTMERIWPWNQSPWKWKKYTLTHFFSVLQLFAFKIIVKSFLTYLKHLMRPLEVFKCQITLLRCSIASKNNASKI